MRRYYTLEKNNRNWVVWLNKESIKNIHGSCGCNSIFSSESKKDCIDYCKSNKIKLKR